ncbi:TPA: hypothetical protein PRT27_002258 [Escherichia coli]|nr:hypothetical protein [Escherichia coli]
MMKRLTLLFSLVFVPFVHSATPNCVTEKSNTVVITQCDDGTVSVVDSGKGSALICRKGKICERIEF